MSAGRRGACRHVCLRCHKSSKRGHCACQRCPPAHTHTVLCIGVSGAQNSMLPTCESPQIPQPPTHHLLPPEAASKLQVPTAGQASGSQDQGWPVCLGSWCSSSDAEEGGQTSRPASVWEELKLADWLLGEPGCLGWGKHRLAALSRRAGLRAAPLTPTGPLGSGPSLPMLPGETSAQGHWLPWALRGPRLPSLEVRMEGKWVRRSCANFFVFCNPPHLAQLFKYLSGHFCGRPLLPTRGPRSVQFLTLLCLCISAFFTSSFSLAISAKSLPVSLPLPSCLSHCFISRCLPDARGQYLHPCGCLLPVPPLPALSSILCVPALSLLESPSFWTCWPSIL